jgi:hypothetical protein
MNIRNIFKKGTTEGTVSTLIGLIIAIAVLYLLWRTFGGGAPTPVH